MKHHDGEESCVVGELEDQLLSRMAAKAGQHGIPVSELPMPLLEVADHLRLKGYAVLVRRPGRRVVCYCPTEQGMAAVEKINQGIDSGTFARMMEHGDFETSSMKEIFKIVREAERFLEIARRTTSRLKSQTLARELGTFLRDGGFKQDDLLPVLPRLPRDLREAAEKIYGYQDGASFAVEAVDYLFQYLDP